MQLYCNSDIRKYKWAKYDNGKRHSKTENDIKLKNGFDSYRKVLEGIDYGQKIANTIFPINYSLEIEKNKKGLQSHNGDSKSQVALKDNEADAISFEIF